MDSRVEGCVRRRRWKYLLALVAAVALGLVAAVPVFAADKADFEPQVVGGDPVPDGKYRFVASLQADTSDAPPYQEHFCGGSLIDRNTVMTAAHCVDFLGKPSDPEAFPYTFVRIVVGVTKLNSDQGQARRIDSLSDISIHPLYRPKLTSKFDVAVIELNRPVSGIEPIKLARVGSDGLERPGRLAKIAGWGNTEGQPPAGGGQQDFPNRLQEAEAPIVSDAECREAYGEVFFRKLMVCAGNRAIDTCQGDSGGPMWVTQAGTRRQIGVTSFGYGCATLRYPGVYTEVNASRIHNFIQRASSG